MSEAEPVLRRSKREHQPSAKATASSASSALPPTASSVSRRSQRRRVTHSASPASTPASTRNSSPVGGPVTSPASSDLVSVVVDAVGPNGQRRRLRAAAHTSVTQGVHSTYPRGVRDDSKVLGRYSSRDCALLCEVILNQLKLQTLAPTVLDEAKSPAFIRWEPVAKKMQTSHKIRVTPRECQVWWKFLAYGEIPAAETDELLPDSDEEDFHKSPKEINAQVAATRAEEKDKTQVVATDEQSEQVSTGDEGKCSGQNDKDETQGPRAEQKEAQSDDTLPENESSVRLYPTYSLPTGAPDAWYRPFGPKDAMPLTFVASRFLRRKPTPPMQSLVGKSTVTLPSTADLKRKQAPANNVAEAKKPKLVTPPATAPPRAFAPSSTPPPAAKRARSELEFFELRLREEHAKKTPGATFALSAADIQRRYGETTAQVKRECQALAAHDVERFNREIVRVRIWEKALGTAGSTPKPTLTPVAIPASKPVASPSQTSIAKPSAGTTATSSVSAPVVTKRSGPTAALLAHAAAVAATAAKARSSTGAQANISTTPKAAQEQKDGEATIVKPAAK
ncbi:Protein Kinase [Phytophthora palmivora]|uniref:Protein Kinase n=1 Tax=Phytophthora palmivora TaxID=4796 RepID=A0A2P4YM72_9STRA|nr:Protein Kinase [Phytophthora palmivora]